MKHGSLFSGIGGFDLASEWMGWENVFHCEWMEFPRKVLDYYWPNADSHIDICKTDFKKYANKIDILTGGFPCQPFSMAGKRKGTEDERYLWGEMLRAVQEIKPKFVIAENVFGITNIDGGLVFEQVCLDLEAEGYEVQPFIIPAAAKNAPHRRDRCWFIGVRNATDNNGIIRREGGESKPRKQSRHGKSNEGCDTQINGIATNSNCNDGRSTNRESKCEESKANGERQQSVHFRIRATSDEGDVTNTNGNGFQQRNGNDEINTSKGGQYALGDIDESIVNGNTSDTERKRLEGHDWKWKRFSINRSDERLFIGAKDKFISTHTECSGGVQISKDIQPKQSNGFKFVRNGRKRNVTNSDSCRQQTLNNKKRFLGQENRSETFSGNSFKSIYREEGWQNFPTQSPICGGDDGIPTELDGITFSKWRAESIKGYGNAIVPQVALELFKVIEKINCNLSK
jgi:DNA-cytosine methyltransferase